LLLTEFKVKKDPIIPGEKEMIKQIMNIGILNLFFPAFFIALIGK